MSSTLDRPAWPTGFLLALNKALSRNQYPFTKSAYANMVCAVAFRIMFRAKKKILATNQLGRKGPGFTGISIRRVYSEKERMLGCFA